MSGPTIERMTADGWARVRAVRLRALADTPDAFGITLAEDLQKPEAGWRERLQLAGAATFLAVVDGRDVGLVVGAPYAGTPPAAGLFAMWVAPQARRRGVGAALVEAHLAWARAQGATRVLLDVADANAPAIGLYDALGFRPTGVTGTLPPPREHVLEHQRERRLVP